YRSSKMDDGRLARRPDRKIDDNILDHLRFSRPPMIDHTGRGLSTRARRPRHERDLRVTLRAPYAILRGSPAPRQPRATGPGVVKIAQLGPQPHAVAGRARSHERRDHSRCECLPQIGGPEALSGLARAFCYAGARSPIVSHWEVEDEAAARLMV